VVLKIRSVHVAKEGQLQNTSMATTPNTQNHPPLFFYAGDLVVGEGVVLNGTLEMPNKAMVSGAINGDLKVRSLAVGIIGKLEGKVACSARLASPILRIRTCDLRLWWVIQV
jgi:hypothetical protein